MNCQSVSLNGGNFKTRTVWASVKQSCNISEFDYELSQIGFMLLAFTHEEPSSIDRAVLGFSEPLDASARICL